MTSKEFMEVHMLVYLTLFLLVITVLALVIHLLAVNRRKMEQAYRELEESRRTLAENNGIIAGAGIGVWRIIQFQGKPLRLKADDTMLELLGLTGQAVTSEEAYNVWYTGICPEALPVVAAAIEKMKSGKKAEITYRWRHPALGLRYVRCGGTAQLVEGKGYVLRGYHYDVTEEVRKDQEREQAMKKAYNEAKDANLAKTTFLNNMSHDIRTPMNAIMGFTSIALKHNPEAPVQECLEKIQQSAEHLLTLINDVLDISRIESGKTKLQPMPVDITTVTDAVLSITQGFLADRELEFRVERKRPDNPWVIADPVRIREVLVNILSNAVKYTDDGGAITFTTDYRPGQTHRQMMVRYRIADTGIGMSEEFVGKIFDEFAQEDNGARTHYKGTGLGMAITKRYVELMGGTIAVESKKGVGSAFTVEIPMELTSREDVAAEELAPEETDLRGVRVLLAEDNDMNAEIAGLLLEERGMAVTRAADGRQAVEMFAGHAAGTFDVILMDIMMPVMDGYEATRRIRAMQDRQDGAQIPIIAMTANAFAEDVQASLDAGMNAHIAKPIVMDEVAGTIARNLHRR